MLANRQGPGVGPVGPSPSTCSPASASGPVASAVDLSISPAVVLSDPGGYIDTISATSVLSTSAGSSSSAQLSNATTIKIDDDLVDGIYTFDLTRDNPGELDKIGLLVGFLDDASNGRIMVGGLFETGAAREIDRAIANTLQYTTQPTIDRARVVIRLATNSSGARQIGPGWAEAYAGETLLESYDLSKMHTVTGNLRKIVKLRRGVAGAVGEFEYTLTQSRADLP
jgi:hypothetical protein